jgi:hypothetical protein
LRTSTRVFGGKLTRDRSAAWVVAIVGLVLAIYASHLFKAPGAGLIDDASIYAIGGVVLSRLATAARERESPRIDVRQLAVELVAVALGLGILNTLAVSGLLLSNGVPAFRHDWVWPADDTEMRSLYSFMTSDWRLQGIGGPKPFPTIYPMYAAMTSLGYVLSTHQVFVVLLYAIALIGGLGSYALSRCFLGAHRAASAVAAVVFAFSPFALDKLVAGHIHILLAYAILPSLLLVMVLADRYPETPTLLWAALAGVLLALGMSAIDCFPYLVSASLLLTFGLVNVRRGLVIAFAATAFGIMCHGQSLYHLFFALDASTAVPRNVETSWLILFSQTTGDALSLLHYIVSYASMAMPAEIPLPIRAIIGPALLGVAFACAIFGSREIVVIILIWMVGVVATTGLLGPFPALKMLLFIHVKALAALREFYNGTMLISLGDALAIGYVFNLMCAFRARSKFATVLVAIGALITVPFLSGGARQINLWAEPAALGRLGDKLTNHGERIAMLPLVVPLREHGNTFGGPDVFFTGFRGHPTFQQEDPPEPLIATAALMYERGETGAANRLMGAMGVRWIVLRRDLTSMLPSYWFPSLFPPEWGKNISYDELLNREPGRDVPVSAKDYVAVRNAAEWPIIAFAEPLGECADNAIIALARGSCAKLQVESMQARGTVEEIQLTASQHEYSPLLDWVAPTRLFMTGFGVAASSAGVATASAQSYSVKFHATRGGTLDVQCLSANGLQLYFDGILVSSKFCKRSIDMEPQWIAGPRVEAGDHEVRFKNELGSSLVTRVVVAHGAGLRDVEAKYSAPWLRPLSQAYQDEHLHFSRLAPTEVSGSYDIASNAALLFTDRFNSDWRLYFDDGIVIGSRKVLGFANEFAVPKGAHSFRILFEPSPLDKALGILQGIMWPFLACLILMSLAWKTASGSVQKSENV